MTTASSQTRVDETELDRVDWRTFDEVVLEGPAYAFALLIYSKPRLIPSMPRGSSPPVFHPSQLLIRVDDQNDPATHKRIRAKLGQASNDLLEAGWLV
ncbi:MULTISPECIES: hypothetical protein [unclassified Roseateles]|uniref:hypothetical protein n=1 Tax=unclassified Roseateles TaxID=2626991 RepID=UPI0006FDCA71|nr:MULTISPECIES: hypothetical protein [unclassified Roseateles]KQW51169.1 hypothetical protein ASC81_00470 [Pelomonas sp. Root405]KRA77400.1 hypothetical protein ASD88_00470 [Pelomonas sp. Root662]